MCDVNFKMFLLKQSFFGLLISISLFQKTLCQNSPCPKVFKYWNEGPIPIGVLRLANIQSTSVNVKVDFSIGTRLSSSYIGALKPVSTNFDSEYQTSGGIIFKVYFPTSNPLPILTSVLINGAVICSGPPAVGSFVSSISLEYTFYLNQNTLIQSQNKNFNPNVFQQNNGYSNNQNIYQNLNSNYQSNNGNFQINNGYNQQNGNTNNQKYSQHKQYGNNKPGSSQKKKQNNKQNFNKYVEELDSSSKINEIANICGNKGKTTSLIVNGSRTKRGDYPWHAGIFLRDGRGINFICGGNLITDQHVLTAAHCLDIGRSKENYLVQLGKYRLKKYNERGTEIRDVISIVINSHYIAQTPDADIGVMMLDEPVKFSNFIHPICLYNPAFPDIIAGETAAVVGWGRDERGNAVTNELKELQIKIIDSEICRHSASIYENIVTDNTFCAEGLEPGSSACNGDSGGGVAMQINNRWYLRGIVSTSLEINRTHPYCNPEKYFILTDTFSYYEWILDIIS